MAYRLGITDIDPLQYDSLFERFLNPERVSMPDIDIDNPLHLHKTPEGTLPETKPMSRENDPEILVRDSTSRAASATWEATRGGT